MYKIFKDKYKIQCTINTTLLIINNKLYSNPFTPRSPSPPQRTIASSGNPDYIFETSSQSGYTQSVTSNLKKLSDRVQDLRSRGSWVELHQRLSIASFEEDSLYLLSTGSTQEKNTPT